MPPSRLDTLTLVIVFAFLGVIVVVLILPDVDLADTAFQRNSSLQVLRVLSKQTAHVSANNGEYTSFRFSGTSKFAYNFLETDVRCCSDLSIHHKALRC